MSLWDSAGDRACIKLLWVKAEVRWQEAASRAWTTDTCGVAGAPKVAVKLLRSYVQSDVDAQ